MMIDLKISKWVWRKLLFIFLGFMLSFDDFKGQHFESTYLNNEN